MPNKNPNKYKDKRETNEIYGDGFPQEESPGAADINQRDVSRPFDSGMPKKQNDKQDKLRPNKR